MTRHANAPAVQGQGAANVGGLGSLLNATHSTTQYSAAHPSFRRTPRPAYDPTGVRPCSSCRRRDGWRRWTWGDTNGGWFCCTPAEPQQHHGDTAHTCSSLCALGGVA